MAPPPVGALQLRIKSRLVAGRDPAYLVLADRKARVVSESGPDLVAQLERMVASEPWAAYPADAATVVSLLSAGTRSCATSRSKTGTFTSLRKKLWRR